MSSYKKTIFDIVADEVRPVNIPAVSEVPAEDREQIEREKAWLLEQYRKEQDEREEDRELSVDELVRRESSRKACEAKKRLRENPEYRAKENERMREYYRLNREKERARCRAYQARRHATETPEEKEERLKKRRLQRKLFRLKNPEKAQEQNEKRNAWRREHWVSKPLTEEQRLARNERSRVAQMKRRAFESPEEKRARLDKAKAAENRKRENMTPEELAAYLEHINQRKKAWYEKNKVSIQNRKKYRLK